ncbi:MAG: amidohydrolase family protein [Phascolarctobacterium sp.]|nr:amidohydrolase family protein [Phascolarctobacterium sp.]
MKIIDAHMHYYNKEGFVEVAAHAGYENTAACWQRICKENNIVFSVAMGNTMYTSSRYGGVPPRLIDLAAPFDEEHYNQPANMGYCMGVQSELITEANAEATAREFEHYIQDEHCLGIKLYPGYESVYVNDRRHWPLFELARAYHVPVVIHTGDTARPDGLLKYSHPLTVDEAAVNFRDVTFVIAHCGCPWLVDACEVAAKNANVAIDVSGLLEGKPKPLVLFEHQAGFWRQLHTWLSYMGDFSRVMYGSDWPLVNIPLYIRMISYIIPEQHYEAVFYENALRIFPKIGALL